MNTADRILLVALLDNYTMQMINLSKHRDVTPDGRRQYRAAIDQAERIRKELEDDRAAA